MTNKIKQFDRPTLRTLRPKLETELKKVGQKFGINFSMGAFTFDSSKFTSRLTVTTSTAKKVETESKTKMLTQLLKDNGINKKWLTKSFNVPGRRGLWTITDYKGSRPKFPWIISEVGGTRQLKCKNVKIYLN